MNRTRVGYREEDCGLVKNIVQKDLAGLPLSIGKPDDFRLDNFCSKFLTQIETGRVR